MENFYDRDENCYGLKGETIKTVSLEIRNTIKFDYQDLEDLFMEAFEDHPISWGKINKSTPEWNSKPDDMPDYQYVLQLLLNGCVVMIDSVQDKGLIWNLSLEDVYYGIKNNASCAGDYSSNFAEDDVNRILQFALFDGIDFEVS